VGREDLEETLGREENQDLEETLGREENQDLEENHDLTGEQTTEERPNMEALQDITHLEGLLIDDAGKC
jgi:hypothetical protein